MAPRIVPGAADWRHTHCDTLTPATRIRHRGVSGVRLRARRADVCGQQQNRCGQPTLGFAPLNRNDTSYAWAWAYPTRPVAVATAQMLSGRSGLAARIVLSGQLPRIGARACCCLSEPDMDTAEALSLRGERDYCVFAARADLRRAWLSSQGRSTRYGAYSDGNIARHRELPCRIRYTSTACPLSLTTMPTRILTARRTLSRAPPTPFGAAVASPIAKCTARRAFSAHGTTLWFDL